jgi:hypothetical protein
MGVGRDRYRIGVALTAAALLAGCGILPRLAQQTTAAAIAPVADTARFVSQSLQVASQNMAVSSLATERTARQVSVTAAQARATARAADQRRQQVSRMAKRNAALRKHAENSDAEAEPFDILPAALLKQLTEDQAALQRAAQKEAFTAPVGETIFWEDSGRTGSAMTEAETPMGSFLCRTFVQAVRLDVDEERATMFACRSPDGIWEPSPQRTELVP